MLFQILHHFVAVFPLVCILGGSQTTSGTSECSYSACSLTEEKIHICGCHAYNNGCVFFALVCNPCLSTAKVAHEAALLPDQIIDLSPIKSSTSPTSLLARSSFTEYPIGIFSNPTCRFLGLKSNTFSAQKQIF